MGVARDGSPVAIYLALSGALEAVVCERWLDRGRGWLAAKPLP